MYIYTRIVGSQNLHMQLKITYLSGLKDIQDLRRQLPPEVWIETALLFGLLKCHYTLQERGHLLSRNLRGYNDHAVQLFNNPENFECKI